jgi:hypothetical protein
VHCYKTDCAVCGEGYSKAIGYQCTQCKSGTAAAIYSGLALIVILIIVALAMIVVQLLGLSDGQDAATNIIARFSALPWNKLRIPIVAFQIVTQFIGITGLPLPDIYRNFLAWTDVFNLNLGWLLSVGCLAAVNFYQRLLITTLGPFVVAVTLASTYAIVRHKNQVQAVAEYSSQRTAAPVRTEKLAKALAMHHSVFLAMTFLIYSTVSTTVFQTFACDTIDDSATIKTSYLRADYSIQCGTAKYTAYKAYAGVMVIVYPLGIPALYAWLLWRSRHKLSSKNDASVRMLHRDTDPSLRPTRFLWKSYTARMYYWEVIESMRRLLLTGAIVFITPGTTAQAAIACVLAVTSAFIALYCRPHADPVDTMIYTVGAMIIFLSMFLSLAMKADISSETNASQDAFAVVLVVLNLAMIVAAFVQMAYVAHRALTTGRNSVLRLVGKSDDVIDDVVDTVAPPAATKAAAASAATVAAGAQLVDVNESVDECGITSSHIVQKSRQPNIRF